MDNKGINYEFSSSVYYYSSSPQMTGWTMVSLPKNLSSAIREAFKSLEEGWGRMKVTAKLGRQSGKQLFGSIRSRTLICFLLKRWLEKRKDHRRVDGNSQYLDTVLSKRP